MDGEEGLSWALDLEAGIYRLIRLEPDVVGPPQSIVVGGWFETATEDWEAELRRILDQRAHYREQRPAECSELRLALDDGSSGRAAHWVLHRGSPGWWHLTGSFMEDSDVTVTLDYVRGRRPGWMRRRTRIRNRGSRSIRVAAVSACRTVLPPGSWTMGSLCGQWGDEARWTAPSFLEAVTSGKVGTHGITEAAPR